MTLTNHKGAVYTMPSDALKRTSFKNDLLLTFLQDLFLMESQIYSLTILLLTL